MASYKQKYERFKKEVDAAMGKPLGKWGQVKAAFNGNNLSDARKQAIDQAEANEAQAVTRDQKSARLYQTHNVIGSTQAHGQLPTVYYRTSSGTFGHITQEHKIADNVGRELARKDARYNFGNTGPNGQLQEKMGSKVFHTSRNPFVPAVTHDERRNLSTAQVSFPNIKARY
jgi:hypothetical protein